MKKLILSVAAILILMAVMMTCALAEEKYYNGYCFSSEDYYDDWYDLYEVCSKNPNGYCYMYSNPTDSDWDSVNLGRHDNGETVRVLLYDVKNSYCLCVCANGRIGFIKTAALKPYTCWGCYAYVYSTSPQGYAYLYSRPTSSDTGSRNLGRYDNGSMMEILDWYASSDYAYVRSVYTGDYGYMRKNQLQ